MKKFNVIQFDFNSKKVEHYNVLPYFREDWNGAFMASLPKSSFPEVTFENSPQMVELKLIKEE